MRTMLLSSAARLAMAAPDDQTAAAEGAVLIPAEPAKTAPAWVTGLTSVLHTILGAVALDPQTKAVAKQTLSDVETIASGAPVIAGELTGAGVQEVEELAPAPVKEVLDATGLEQFGATLAASIVEGLGAKLEATFEAHNKNTIKAVNDALAVLK